MSAPLRLGFGRIAQETNTFSTVPTRLADFQLFEGPALLAACDRGGDEAPGFTKRAELAGFMDATRSAKVEAVPLFSAWAVPSGPLEPACFEAFLEKLETSLAGAGKLDGIYLCLHGAMGAEGVRDPETRILERVRALAPGVPLITTHDLHANLTEARVQAVDAILSYRTNPHRDHARVGRRAGELLIRRARGEIRPVIAWRSLPMLLGGGTTLDFWPPMRAVFQRMRAMERDPKLLAASVNMCHPWNNDPALGWSVSIVTDGDRDLAERAADELAEMCWARKDAMPPEFPSVERAIEEARSARLLRKLGVVTLADASDVVSAGAPGENTALVKALLERGQGLLSYVPLRDPAAVAELWPRAVGEVVEARVGGRLDPVRGKALDLKAKIIGKQDRPGFLRTLVLAVGDVRLVVTEGPALAIKPSFYADVGLPLWRADIVVVKNFFPFRLFFLPYSRKTIYVRTSGVTDFDAAFALPFDGPMHPREPVADWRPSDRRRRGLSP
ncbi:MAG: M81 family metallopeptidase [Myxococcota bacterium]